MKPTNWRTYYGYRPSRSLSWKNPPSHDREMTREYLEWLAQKRGCTRQEASMYVDATQRHCGIIKAEYAPEPAAANGVKEAIKRARSENALGDLLVKIKKLDWTSLEAVQHAIDQRLAA